MNLYLCVSSDSNGTNLDWFVCAHDQFEALKLYKAHLASMEYEPDDIYPGCYLIPTTLPDVPTVIDWLDEDQPLHLFGIREVPSKIAS